MWDDPSSLSAHVRDAYGDYHQRGDWTHAATPLRSAARICCNDAWGVGVGVGVGRWHCGWPGLSGSIVNDDGRGRMVYSCYSASP